MPRLPDYCDCLYHSLPITKIKCLQHIQNGLARPVTRTPKHFHITPVLKSLFIGLKSNNAFNIRSSLLQSPPYNRTKVPSQAHKYQTPGRTRSSDYLCLFLPPVAIRLKFADCSFCNSSPYLWNSLPINLISFAPDTHCSTAVISSTPSHPSRALLLLFMH